MTAWRLILLITLHSLLGAAALGQESRAASSGEQPNILWLVTEDNSADWLRLYNENGAPMPTVERLAKGGLVFSHAFAPSPVCSVARSAIISGCDAPRIGAQYHRRREFVPMPEGVRMFPAYLREAGYYTSNNSKEDYNIAMTPGTWDESSRKATWRNRKPGQPFFHVQNFGTTHEGRLHFTEEEMESTSTRTDPDSVSVFPYHPDTTTFRYTHAKYLDLHEDVDPQLGELLAQLEKDGVMEDTIIFYYGDHGGVLPRSKGYIYESGLRVPMVVHFPEKWQHLAPAAPGTTIDGFVSFIDLGPTVLNLAGLPIPSGVDGKPFLGSGVTLEELNKRDRVFSYADRFDAKYDPVRGLRTGDYKYIRNYQPFNFDALYNEYRYHMLAYKEWRDLYRAGKLDAVQSQFFLPRAPEALYDLSSDPDELNNVALDPDYAETLATLRAELQARVKGMPDLSFVPEPRFLEQGIGNPVEFGRKHAEEIARLVDIADLTLLPFTQARRGIKQALSSESPWERYWGLIVCSSFGADASRFTSKAKKLLNDENEDVLVRARAAEFLALIGRIDPSPVFADLVLAADNAVEASFVLNSAVMLSDSDPPYTFDFSAVSVPKGWLTDENKESSVARQLRYLDEQASRAGQAQ